MSTDDLGRTPRPVQHQSNAFSMLRKTAQPEAPKEPEKTEQHSEKPAKPPRKKTRPKNTSSERPATTSTAGGVAPESPSPDAPTPVEPSTVPAPASPASTAAKSEPKERATELITLYLPLDLREMFRNQAKAEKLSHPLLAFTAIEVAYPHLSDLLSQQVSGSTKTPQVSLFQRSSNNSRGRTNHTKAHGDLQFRITKTNAEILDRLVDEFDAPSRSVLITTAIRHYLDYPITDDE